MQHFADESPLLMALILLKHPRRLVFWLKSSLYLPEIIKKYRVKADQKVIKDLVEAANSQDIQQVCSPGIDAGKTFFWEMSTHPQDYRS